MAWLLDFSDDFNRANGALGSNYTYGNGTAPVIASNLVSMSAAGGSAYYNAKTFTDVAVELTIGSNYPAVNLRDATGAGTTGTCYQVVFESAGANTFGLYKYIAGANTYIGGVSATLVAGNVVRVELVGSSFKYYQNGVLKGSQTDSSITAGGYVALASPPAWGVVDTADDFKIYSVAIPPSYPGNIGKRISVGAGMSRSEVAN